MLLSHSTKECLYNFFLFPFVIFAAFLCAERAACFDRAVDDTKACNEHTLTFINLPYTMVVNCNTVLFEFGVLSATHRTGVNLNRL